MNTAVALLIFNRPETTARVFAAIRDARPSQLFVIADGPRRDRPGEAELCAQARAVVQVDWPCDVRTNFADENMGCGPRPASGIDWVFGQVEEAIILEDDCVPHPSFFPFCEEMLARYRGDPRVMQVSGSCFLEGGRRGPDSYYFSRLPLCWGWATWRRAWQCFDFDTRAWPEAKADGVLRRVFDNPADARYWEQRMDEAHGAGKSHIWDYQWLFAIWMREGQSIAPRVNLVANIGSGLTATHTKGYFFGTDLPAQAMPFPLTHPAQVTADGRADAQTHARHFRLSLANRLRRKARALRARRASTTA